MKRVFLYVLSIILIVCGCVSCVLLARLYCADKFSDTEGSAVLNIETYIDGQNQPTHPSVIDLKQPWNGFRYWMSYSPYPWANGAEENPCVCASNDMLSWLTPEGLYNPIADNEESACDELKDPHIVYNNDLDRMEVWYLGREDSTIKSGGKLLLFRKVSYDGVQWSTYEVMRDLEGYLSPSITYSEGKYQLWAIQASNTERDGALLYSESTDGKKWTPYENCTFGDADKIEKVWHGSVSCDSKVYRFTYTEIPAQSDGIYYTESIDGMHWRNPQKVIEKAGFWKGYYRPCVINSEDELFFVYGVITKENEWYLSMSRGSDANHLHGITAQDIGMSLENEKILDEQTFSHFVRSVYRIIREFCRPELLIICIAVAIVLLLIRRYSLELLWGMSWVLFVLRFSGQIRWLTISEIMLMLFTAGLIGLICSLAIMKFVECIWPK